jgi:hypothetical protein
MTNTDNSRDMTAAANAERRMRWAENYGQALIAAGDRSRAAVYSKIGNEARAELSRLTGFDFEATR